MPISHRNTITITIIIIALFISYNLIKTSLKYKKEKTKTITKYVLNSQRKSIKSKNIVLVGGCFDVLHYGHISFLQKAKESGDYLIIALEPDSRIIEQKKRIPIHNQEQRATILNSLECVDEVLLLPKLEGFKDYNKLVEDIRPNIIATISSDPQLNNKHQQAIKIKGKVIVIMDEVSGFSSTNIIQKLSE